MRNFIRNISRVLMVLAVGLFLWDLVYQWIVNAKFLIRKGSEMWPLESTPALQPLVALGLWDKLAPLPAAATPAVFGLFFYIIFRILAAFDARGKSGRI